MEGVYLLKASFKNQFNVILIIKLISIQNKYIYSDEVCT